MLLRVCDLREVLLWVSGRQRSCPNSAAKSAIRCAIFTQLRPSFPVNTVTSCGLVPDGALPRGRCILSSIVFFSLRELTSSDVAPHFYLCIYKALAHTECVATFIYGRRGPPGHSRCLGIVSHEPGR